MRYESVNDTEQKISSKETPNSYAWLHFHRSIEIHYVLKGKYEITIGTSNEIISPGDIGFVPPYFPHGIKPIEDSLDEVFIVPYSYFAPFEKANISLNFFKLSNKELNKEIYGYIIKIKERLEQLKTKQSSTHDLLLQGYVNVIFSLIVDNYNSQQISKHSIKSNTMIEEIITYIDRHYKEDITLDFLASKFGYTKFYFSKIFNNLFGCTLKSYINSVRVYHILDNAEGTNITDSILNAGYKNLSTFYKYKKKIKDLRG